MTYRNRIVLTKEPLHRGKISPFIYGEFIEFLNDLIPGMWSELLRDRSFRGLTQPSMCHDPRREFHPPAWETFTCLNDLSGSVEYHAQLNLRLSTVVYSRDFTDPWVGKDSVRLIFNGSKILGGIRQRGVAVRKGMRYVVEVIARGDSRRFLVLVGRDYGAYFDAYGSNAFPMKRSGGWRKYTAVITSPVTDADAEFAVVLDEPGVLNIGKVSLMPEDNARGWRKDVVEEVRSSKPGMIRFGGSSLHSYDWKRGIGPRDRRAPFLNPPWDNTEENDVGLDEFLAFCDLVNAEPLVCVNATNARPEDVAEQVEYCNGGPQTKWGRARAANGHPKSYNVKYWQIGNELSGKAYEEKMPAFAEAMKKKDSSIILLSAFPSEDMIKSTGRMLDVICPHYYTGLPEHARKCLDDLRGQIERSPTRHLKIGVTEWNTAAGDWGPRRAWMLTLWNGLLVARFLNMFQRNSDLVIIANRSNLCNSGCCGGLQASPSDMFFTPAHHVQKAYANLCGDIPLRVEYDGSLDVSATLRSRGRATVVAVVNMADKETETILSPAGGRIAGVEGWCIGGKPSLSVNSFEKKDEITLVPYKAWNKETRGLSVTIPRNSVVFVVLHT